MNYMGNALVFTGGRQLNVFSLLTTHAHLHVFLKDSFPKAGVKKQKWLVHQPV